MSLGMVASAMRVFLRSMSCRVVSPVERPAFQNAKRLFLGTKMKPGRLRKGKRRKIETNGSGASAGRDVSASVRFDFRKGVRTCCCSAETGRSNVKGLS